MSVIVNLYSKKNNEISRFLNSYDKNTLISKNILEWKKEFNNPIEISDIIGVFIDNTDDFKELKMWICLDKNIFINITQKNANEIIRYLIDNNDKFDINMWISLDDDFYINVTNHNADKIIRYLFERYPY